MSFTRKIPRITTSLLAIAAVFFMTPFLNAQAQTVAPTITQIGVSVGEEVEVEIQNLPADTDFTVTEGAVGTQGIGPVIAHFNSATGGTRIYWFEILTDVRTADSAVIRIDGGNGLVAYTTFQNTTTYQDATTLTNTTATPVTGTPVVPIVETSTGFIRVLHAQQGGYVVVQISNLPVDTEFSVMMGDQGTQGLNGYKVANLKTGDLSTHISLFSIPVPLASNAMIDLRIQAPGYLYLATFSNANY